MLEQYEVSLDLAATGIQVLSNLDGLRALIDLVETPIFVKDRLHRFVLVNQAACELLGQPRCNVIGRTDHDFLPREQADIYVANDRLVFETGRSNENEELLTDGGGRVRTLLTRKSLLKLPTGEEFVAVYITDVTDFRGAEMRIRYNAEHDGLTGLANRMAFQRQLKALLESPLREPQPVGILLIELDSFRSINNALGRAAGDNLLIQFAQLLSDASRPTDLVARLGGDEFAIVQPAAGQ